jgi:hypothetical protein
MTLWPTYNGASFVVNHDFKASGFSTIILYFLIYKNKVTNEVFITVFIDYV